MKYKTIEPNATKSVKVKCVIEFVPRVKRNVGIGYIDEREADLDDFKKYPVVLRPWINLEAF
jgi:hypothetical protein